MTATPDLSTPASRRELLRSIPLDDPGARHGLLRQLFSAEVAWREDPTKDEVSDEFENVYVCAYLLFLIGDVTDAPMLYEAKVETLDQDLGMGMYIEPVFGAGIDETLDWLAQEGHTKKCEVLAGYVSSDGFDVERWASATRDYYYPNGQDLCLDPIRADERYVKEPTFDHAGLTALLDTSPSVEALEEFLSRETEKLGREPHPDLVRTWAKALLAKR